MSVTLAELAIQIPASISLFEKYDLNYYQNGAQTFISACEEKQLLFSEIDAELTLLQHESNAGHLLSEMSINRLIDFIEGQYHSNETYILTTIHANIHQLLKGEKSNEVLFNLLVQIEHRFKNLMEKLIQHCKKEDEILFPYIRKLFELRRNKTSISSSKTISLIKNPIRMLEAEHLQAANILAEIKKIASSYITPANAPNEYVTLMESLKDFEKDLHMHLHIENNILFPKLIALEEELNSRIK